MKILIATDGSQFSVKAAEKIFDLVRSDGNPAVKIISVYEAQVPIVAAEPFAISAEFYQKLDETAREQAKTAADGAAAIIKNRYPDIQVDTTTVVELGRPAQAIVETATSWHADLIIVGSHGRGFWGRLTLGSVSDEVVHNAPCSVLVVREK